MSAVKHDAGSFRDPSGRVYILGDRVFRTIMPPAVEDFEFVRDSGVLEPLVDKGWVIPEQTVNADVLGGLSANARYVLEHPKIPFISYPYEWSFAALKAAALLHLDIHLEVLKKGVTLTDATAYNIQFQGPHPIFIDRLSFRRYREGEFWIGHRQYCEQFLNPLLLRAIVGIPHNAWYRGSLEGLTAQELSRVLPVTRKISWNVLTHVVLQASFQKTAMGQGCAEIPKKMAFPLAAFQRMLGSLRKWIVKLEPADTGKTVWSEYAQDNSYSSNEARKKREFVAEFVATAKPAMLWDIGCNTGDYSKAALEAGAGYAIGFEFDQGALNAAFSRSKQQNLNFLPLYLDAANPAPSQGWAEQERVGLVKRAKADSVLALAVVHHLAIGRNVPLEYVVDWLVNMAPTGIIEFVQETDPMVQELLRLREDIFADYNEDTFVDHLESRAEIVKTATVSSTNRRLFWYKSR